ncbi:MAG: 16S rRNA (guanine(527)-N(7))-methyltransferase RsmG [Pseudomonadota bacterium]|nr:16S rRNA (guanine(527)-N(7))-methyltransferase RsmG [Pseudomonadota bacterium]
MALIAKWRLAYNLTGTRDAEAIARLHIVDSLACVPALRRTIGFASSLLDVGSGAGLPGVVFAICCPGLRVSCVDRVGKKVGFVRQVALELGLGDLEVLQQPVESMTGQQFSIIAARAFASLGSLVDLTQHLLQSEGRWMALKGETPDFELHELASRQIMFHVERLPPSPGMERREIVWMSKVG